MKHTGSCHCQKVKFEVDADIKKAMACNCSICAKKATLLIFVPDEKFTLVSGKEDITDYQFGKKTLHHEFCSTCGVAVFGHGTGPDGKKMRAVNIRCLDGIDVDQVPLDHYDGKSR